MHIWGGALCGLQMGVVIGGLPRPCQAAIFDHGFVAAGTGVRFDARERRLQGIDRAQVASYRQPGTGQPQSRADNDQAEHLFGVQGSRKKNAAV